MQNIWVASTAIISDIPNRNNMPQTSIPIDSLRCPVSSQEMRPGTPAEIQSVIDRQAAGSLIDESGAPVTGQIDALLVCIDGARGYPVRDGIPVLLPGCGIPV